MSGGRIRAALFDLDGTILYTLGAIAQAGNRMLRELGYHEEPLDAYRYYCGDGSDELVRRCLRAVRGYTEENFRAGCILNRKYLEADPLKDVRPYEGIPEALRALKNRGIKLAVVSNKPDRAAKDTVAGIFGDLFDYVQGQMDPVPVKPDPEIAWMAAKALGAAPGECLYFGDTGTDMQTGRNAGMYTVGVLWGYREQGELLDSGACRLIRRPSEMIGAADELDNLFEMEDRVHE